MSPRIDLLVGMTLVVGGCAADTGMGAVGKKPAGIDFVDESRGERPPVDMSDALREAAHTVEMMASTLPDDVTGARLEGNELVVAIPDGPDADARELRVLDQLARSAGAQVTVTFVRVEHTRAELEAIRDGLKPRLLKPTTGITGLGLDPSRGVVTVYANDTSEDIRRELRDELGSAIEFRRGEILVGYSRLLDTAPQIGGAGYMVRDTATSTPTTHARTPWCSTAFPIDAEGGHYMLTAGHCLEMNDPFPWAWAERYTGWDRTYYFGMMHTTTYPGAAFVDGDWALLSGSTYRARVYDTDTTAVDVVAADWGKPSVNEQVCISGRTSGKVCRLLVTDPDITAYECDRLGQHCAYADNLVRYRSDQNLDGVNDCNIGQPGDSGGAVFQWTGSNFRAMGIMTGGSTGSASTCTDDRGFYTRLSAVRIVYPDATVPTL